MAGEPILIARNCALVIVDEPLAMGVLAATPDLSIVEPLSQAIGAPVLDLRGSGDFVVDDGLRSKIADLKRRSLILVGGLLEGAVTQIALSALLEGYDIYVCADLVASAEPAREYIFLQRLRFCAGHIVTARQIILELLSQEKDESMRAPLEALLNKGASG